MSISFLYPIFLWSLFALAIPIIIHLFQKKKIVKLHFSTTIFFKSTALKKSKIRRINKILQLIVRLLILLIIILLFSTPIKNDNPFNNLSSKKSKLYCWIDKSLSMDVITNNQSIINKAKEIATEFDTTLPGELLIYDNNQFKKLDDNFKFKTEVKHISFKDFYFNFIRLNKNENNSLLIISDMQKNNVNIFDLLKNEEPFLTTIVDLSPRNLNNISIDSVHINSDNEKSIFVNLSKAGKPKITSLELISNKMRRGVAPLKQKENFKFYSTFKISDDINSGSIKTNNHDNFLHDNQIFFSEAPKSTKKILIINENIEFSHLYEAINSIVDSSLYKVTKKTVITLNAEDIDESDIIVINSIKSASSIIYSLLKPGFFTEKNILFSPSHLDESSVLNSEILKYLGYQHPKITIDTTLQFPSKTLSSQYLWKGFNQSELNQIKLNSTIKDLPGNSILKTNNKQKLISKVTDKNNSTWIISSVELELSSKNNLTMSGFYIPLIDKILNQLKITGNNSAKGYIAGTNFISPLQDPKNTLKVTGDQFNQIFSSPILRVDKPGIYQVHNSIGNTVSFPVNFNSDELNLSYIDTDEIEFKKNIKIIKPHKITNFLKEIKLGNFEKYLVIILLILILMELYLTISLSLYNRNLSQQS